MNSFEAIKNCSLLSGVSVSDEDLGGLLIRSYKKGDTIYGKSDFPKAVGILLSGKASARPVNGGNTVLKKYECSSIFGVASVFGEYDSFVSEITADSTCEVCFIDEKKLRFLFFKYPQISINYISFLCSRIHYLNSEIALFTSSDASSKVLQYLKKAADKDGYVGKIVMAELSRKLSIGRTSLYRAFSELENNKKITRTNGKIKVIL